MSVLQQELPLRKSETTDYSGTKEHAIEDLKYDNKSATIKDIFGRNSCADVKYHDDPIVRDLEIMTGATNYRDWILNNVSSHIGDRILEIGSGIGNYTSKLSEYGSVMALDIYKPCIGYLSDKFRDNKRILPVNIDITSKEALAVKEYRPNTAVCINVLEHIKDDMQALKNTRSVLTEDGKLILLVPAYKVLFGSIDRLVGHHRRYGKKELKLKLHAAGFKVRELFYMNSIAVPFWYINNRIIKLKEESLSQVLLYDKNVVPLLSKVERFIKPPFGLSVVAVAYRN